MRSVCWGGGELLSIFNQFLYFLMEDMMPALEFINPVTSTKTYPLHLSPWGGDLLTLIHHYFYGGVSTASDYKSCV